MSLSCDVLVDACGLACPMPLLKAKQGMNAMEVGQVLQVTATDAGSVRDFHSWCELSGNEMLHYEQVENTFVYLIKKK